MAQLCDVVSIVPERLEACYILCKPLRYGPTLGYSFEEMVYLMDGDEAASVFINRIPNRWMICSGQSASRFLLVAKELTRTDYFRQDR
jgi:hypothetical protein